METVTKLNNSEIRKEVQRDGIIVRIDVYSNGEEGWLVEIVDEYWNSTCWNEPFKSAQEALEAGIKAIDTEGIQTFVGPPDEANDNDMDKQDKRIHEILGSACDRNRESTCKYLKHLRKNIKEPCNLTGIEDFPWEEPYAMGNWDKKEYEKLKKEKPSYTDKYLLMELLEPESEDDDILAKVKRISDQKVFEIGLSWLECVDSKSKYCQLFDDYAVWQTNY